MTSNTAPSGQSAVASSEFSSQYAAYMAFDGAASTYWGSAGTSSPGVLRRTTTAARRVGAYAITASPSGSEGQTPTAWTFWGSNDDGATRTTLDTQTGQGWSVGQRRVYSIPSANRGSYKTYGITCTANGSSTAYSIAALETMLETSTIAAMDLRSVAFQAQAVPTKGSIFALVKATMGTLTPNTNLTAKISRDGGTTETTVTLQSLGTLPNGYTIVEANNADISGQPSGSSLKYRLQTVGTSLGIVIDAVVFSWG